MLVLLYDYCHLGILSSLQLLLHVVEGVGEAGDLHGELLLQGIALLHTETGLVLVLLLPVGVLSLPLADGALQVDLHLPQLLDLNHEGLDVPLQGGDLGLGGIAAEKKDVIVSSKQECKDKSVGKVSIF